MIYLPFKHLSLEEREKLYAWKEKGLSLRKIAKKLDRPHSTLVRELKRNTKYGKEYLPCVAQARAKRVGDNQRYKAPLKSPEVFLYVREHLRSPHFWTPEMISGRISLDIKGTSISTETIYQYIYNPKNRKYKLWEKLPSGRKKRRKKLGRKVQKNSRIPHAVSIDLRPKSANNRTKLGHWETDNVESPRASRPALSVCVERKIRFISISKVKNKTALEKTKSLIKTFSKLPPPLKQSITLDNGSENTSHIKIAQILGTKMYFCHPYHSWEKGSVENRNRVIRRFFPKGTDFSLVTLEQLKFVETVINNMPLKVLKFKKPSEKMQQLEFKLNQIKP